VNVNSDSVGSSVAYHLLSSSEVFLHYEGVDSERGVISGGSLLVKSSWVDADAPVDVLKNLSSKLFKLTLVKSMRSEGVIRMSGVFSNIRPLYCSHSMGV